MADEEEGPQYQWTSLELPPEGVDENPTEKFVKAAGR